MNDPSDAIVSSRALTASRFDGATRVRILAIVTIAAIAATATIATITRIHTLATQSPCGFPGIQSDI
jgi:ABC-type polysaccharide transport system permease subunit